MKQALVYLLILAPPHPQLPFVLDTEASGFGIGAVLSQVYPDRERVVAYVSKVLSKAEKRYCVTPRELLAASGFSSTIYVVSISPYTPYSG